MKKRLHIHRILGLICMLVLATSIGCSDEAKDKVKDAADKTETAAENAVEKAGDMAQAAGENVADAAGKAKDAVAKLSKDAIAYLKPIKDGLGNLDSLKDKPAELKTAVDNLLKHMEQNVDSLHLPEKVTNALKVVKEKLVALKDYLAGEADKAKIEEHIKNIIDSAKERLGIS